MRILCSILLLLGVAPLVAQDLEVPRAPGVTLAGTLELPPDATIGVVLLPVAGPTDRNLTLGPKRFFADLAAALANHGIASARFDDRGVGASTGDWTQTTFADRGEDACHMVRTMRTEAPQLATVGLIGISEGAALALYAHHQCDLGDFIVLLSMPVMTGRATLEAQMTAALAQFPGLNDTQREQVAADANNMLQLVSSEAEDAETRLRELIGGPTGSLLVPPYHFIPADVEGKVRFLRSPWYQSQVGYDVSNYFPRSGVPVLAIYGSLDRVINAERHLRALRREARISRSAMYMGLNHLLQEAKTGSPLEYAALDGTIANRVMEEIAEWVKSPGP